MMIYIFSNVEYPESRKLTPQKEDLLVFLNKAASISYYKDHAKKMVIHRMNEASYGSFIPGVRNMVVFGDKNSDRIPPAFIQKLKKDYDWDYPIEEGRSRCATTGYMVTKYIAELFPQEKIILVNFGYDVKKSTYRCPWHNWKFEAEKLSEFQHIYTAEIANRQGQLKVLVRTLPWLGDNIYTSAVMENLAATGKVKVNVLSHCTDLWENCHFLDKSITEETADYIVDSCNELPWSKNTPHIIEGTTKHIAGEINLHIPIRYRDPVIYADLPEERRFPFPYVILNTGWQNSAPAKKWLKKNWERLIQLCPDVQFIQIGQKANHAEPLAGCMDLIDKTARKDLIHLVRDASCVISPPSGVIHIAAAFHVPFLSLAGGREPHNLAHYPCGVTLSTVGTMQCCKNGGCRCKGFDEGERQCKNIVTDENGEQMGACMEKITPEIVCEILCKLIRKEENVSA